MKHGLTAAAAFAIALGVCSAGADTLPGVRGVNHIGLTVPDIGEAETFFSDVLGCEKATSFGPFRDDTGTFMQDLLDVDPRAVVNQITLMGPFPVNEGPAAGQSIIYFFAPWGLQMEAISFPEGMAYEKDGGPVLWSNTAPAE